MGKPKVLVVDDEPHILVAVKSRLAVSGYEVITAVDGQEALDKARTQNPDLIILDLMLPKLDGYEVCSMLKQDTRYEKIPILMLTARARLEDEQMGIECGASALMRKPYDSKVLLDKIQSLLSERK